MKALAEVTRNSMGSPVVLVNCVLIGDCDLKEPSAESEAEVISQFLTLSQDYELAFRIYRTNAGLRAICVSDPLRPSAPLASRLLEDIGSDPRYNRSIASTGMFSARLGPKPQRIGMEVPEKFNFYALLPRDQKEWTTQYDELAVNYKSCEFVLQTGASVEMPSQILNFINLHDGRSRCFEDLPLA